MLRQCATTAITAVYAASIMFTMAAMLGRLVAQLKMPRLDAYAVSSGPLGFSTTKIAADGSDLPDSATTWSCVRDNVTGLYWEAEYATNGSFGFTNIGDLRAADASTYAQSKNAARSCGFSDWRLPTVAEQMNLVNLNNVVGFSSWSSDASAANAGQSWILRIGGYDQELPRTNRLYLRLVAGDSARSVGPYTYSTDGTVVTDVRTGLTWSRCSEGQNWNGVTCTGTATRFTLESGLAYAKAKGGGWRVPNIKELNSIVDRSRSNPAIDIAAFPGTLTGYHTSTPQSGGWARAISFDNGGNGDLPRDLFAYLRLVR